MDYIKDIRSLVGRKKIILNFVGACIRNQQGEILLQKRTDKHLWGFPGGTLELEESLEEALVREINEETGLEVKLLRLIGIYPKYEDSYPNGDEAQTITHLFEVTVTGGTLITSNDETLELKYFSLNNFPKLVNQQHNAFKQDIEKDKGEYPFIR